MQHLEVKVVRLWHFLTWDEEASRVWFVFHQIEKCSGNLANVKSKIWSHIVFTTWRVERAEVSTELLSIPNIACNVAFHLVFWSSGHDLDVDAFLSCSPRPCWGGSNHSVASPFGHSGWFSQSQDHLVCGCSRESNLNKPADWYALLPRTNMMGTVLVVGASEFMITSGWKIFLKLDHYRFGDERYVAMRCDTNYLVYVFRVCNIEWIFHILQKVWQIDTLTYFCDDQRISVL